MERTYLKSEIARLFTEAQKLEGDLARNHTSWGEWQSKADGTSPPPEWLVEEDDTLVEPFKYLAKSLYLTTICLLDELNLHAYMKQFFKEFGDDFNASKAASEFQLDHYWSGDFFNVFLSDFRQFLKPLDVLSDESRYRKLAGVQYLEVILNNTALIITKSGLSPKSEPEVYKAVRGTLEAIFPSAKSPLSNFIKTAQEYKPDILVPELSAVIEYKYAASESKLKATIGQISDDVKGYTGDPDYNLYYAVFYVTKDFWGSAKFSEVWKEKEFPENWIGIYVVGS